LKIGIKKIGDVCGVSRLHQTQSLWMRTWTHDRRMTKRDSVPLGRWGLSGKTTKLDSFLLI